MSTSVAAVVLEPRAFAPERHRAKGALLVAEVTIVGGGEGASGSGKGSGWWQEWAEMPWSG